MRPRLIVLDAPGGPHPAQYLPPLLDEFEVHVAWLAVEPPARRAARTAAVRAADSALGVADPARLPAVVDRLVSDRGADGILGLSERTVHVAQLLAHRRGLSANPPDVVLALQDKHRQRERLRSAGLPAPAATVLRAETDCAAAAVAVGFPAVLKPAMGMGSLATFRVATAAELVTAWRRGRALVDRDPRTAHLDTAFVLEQELPDRPGGPGELGDHVSVDTLTVDGTVHVVAVADKLPLSPPFRENGHLLPTTRSGAELTGVVSCALESQRALGVRYGACHTEVKLTPGGPRVIEVNGRPGGSVPELLRLTAGYDLVLQLARLACRLPAGTAPAPRRHGGCLTPQPPVGRHLVTRAPTEERVRRAGGVATIYHLVRTGQTVDSDLGSASQLVRLTAVADDRAGLLGLRRQLTETGLFRLVPAQPAANPY